MNGRSQTLKACWFAGRLARAGRKRRLWQAEQNRLCRGLLARAWAGSAFYRSTWERAGCHISQVLGTDDLRRLPVSERALWRGLRADEIMTVDVDSALMWHPTGGSSGPPLRMPYLPADDVLLRASVLAVIRAHGGAWTDRALWMLPPDTHARGGYRMLGRVRLIDSDARTEERLDALSSGSEPVLRGYPWPVWRAVVRALRAGRSLPARRLFVTGGEPLPLCVRRTLAQGLGAQVVNRYAATDFGPMAADCRAGRLQVSVGAHVDIVCGDRQAEPGEEGEVVATNLLSRARPLIRVRTGDRAAWSVEPCPCGSGLPHLDHVSGRNEDCIVHPSGRRIRQEDIERALGGAAQGLYGFQAEQIAQDGVLIRLSVQAKGAATGVFARPLEQLFDGMRVRLECTDDFPVEANGKTRVCR
ncbi:MAG: hypothetical protein PHR35_11970 [Kiritimatiellae bacterium]|nr:hypothetical protein [Kiritimatiellia bacterium]